MPGRSRPVPERPGQSKKPFFNKPCPCPHPGLDMVCFGATANAVKKFRCFGVGLEYYHLSKKNVTIKPTLIDINAD
ncbi:MAG: hypothetical protein K8S16_18965 [Bacteroidales bacterium]|nr:hypothetical protein [Bacteroidales bacterium]